MFKVFFVNHSHIDIGYTERQEKIANYQADFVKQAVQCANAAEQKKRTQQGKFHFTAEGFWAVEQYLKRYGEEGRKQLVQAIQSGYFELTAAYFHLQELLNYSNMNHSLDYCRDFALENGLEPTKVAMASDINGFSWGYADALYDHGIRYLETNINTHHGGVPFSKPLVPFWWESPKGRKILVWSGFSYHKANLLGLIPGYAPGGNPGIPGMLSEDASFVYVDGPDYAYSRISQMIDAIKKSGYPYDFVLITGSSLYTDNSPISDSHCRIVEQFNEKYGDEIEVISTTLDEYFKYLEEFGGEFPVYRGDWNDWWTDGAISTPNETRIFRNAQRVNEWIKKLDPEEKTVTREEHEEIENLLIAYAEHTWGHSNSMSDPYKLLVTQLDVRKSKLAIDADVLAGTAFDKLSLALGEGEFTSCRPFRYTVINPNDSPKQDIVHLFVDFWEDGMFEHNGFRVVDEQGHEFASQKTHTMRGSVVACSVRLAPHEKKVLTIEFSPDFPRVSPAEVRNVEKEEIFENDFYRITYNQTGVKSFICKATGEELLIADAPGLGQPVYQLFPGGDRTKPAGFGYTARVKPEMELHYADTVNFSVVESGAVQTQLLAEFKIKGALKCFAHYYLFNDLPKIIVTVEMAKDLVMDPEGMYVSLPLQVKNGEWYLDKAGAFFKPGEQLPDGCCDYYPVVRGTVLSGDDMGIAVNTLDSPMITINRIKLWDFTHTADTTGPVYSWITNNKWETNFRTQCADYLESRYVIEPDVKIKTAEKGLDTLESNEYDLFVARA